MNKNFIYYPSLSVGILGDYLKNDKLINNISPRFYLPNNDLYHPYFLLTAGHHYKNINIRKEWNMDNINVIGDSGGYQIATGKLKFKPELTEQIFNWLENNSNVAINLDIPPRGDFQNRFNESLELSKRNFEYFEKHQTGKTKFLNVIQGTNGNEYETWYNNVKHFNFKGWAFGGNLDKTLYIISLFLQEKELEKSNIEWIHILGRSEISDFVVLEIIQKFLNIKFDNKIQISTDSSTPALCTAYGEYKYDINWEKLKLKTIHIHRQLNSNSLLPCDCIYCKDRTFLDYQKWKAEDYALLSLHNLKKFTDNIKKIQKLINSAEDAIKDVIPNIYFKIYQIIKQIFEGDKPLQVYNKYINIIQEVTSIENRNQDNKLINNLFDF